MRTRDPTQTQNAVLSIQEWTNEVMDRFRRSQDDRELVPEVQLPEINRDDR